MAVKAPAKCGVSDNGLGCPNNAAVQYELRNQKWALCSAHAHYLREHWGGAVTTLPKSKKRK